MKNLLYQPQAIRRPSPIDLLLRDTLPFPCHTIIDDGRNFLLLGEKGRIHSSKNGYLGHAFREEYKEGATLFGENFAAISDLGEVGFFYRGGDSFYRIRNKSGDQPWITKEGSLLQATDSGILLFEKGASNLLYHEKFSESFATWEKGGHEITYFLPGPRGALFLRDGNNAHLGYITHDLKIHEIVSAAKEEYLFTAANRDGMLYIVEGRTLSKIDFHKGSEARQKLTLLEERPKKIRSAGNNLVLFYREKFVVMNEDRIVSRRKIPTDLDDVSCIDDKVIALQGDHFLSWAIEK